MADMKKFGGAASDMAADFTAAMEKWRRILHLRRKKRRCAKAVDII